MAINSSQQIDQIIRARNFGKAREILEAWSPPEIATLFDDLAVEEQAIVFRILPRKLAASVFEYLPLKEQESLLKNMAQEEVAGVLNDMSPDDRTLLFDELPASVTKQLLSLLTPDERAIAVSLLGYPEGSVGRLMTPDYVRVKKHWAVEQVLDHIRKHGQDSETLSMTYVVDDEGCLIGELRNRSILLAAPAALVSDLMNHRLAALKATDDQERAVEVFGREDRYALPVTDSEGKLIGIVTVDDVLDVAEREATEDIQKIGGMEALDQPYMEIALPHMVKKRAGWLVILFLGEMFTATAMGFFQREIERAVVLALFVPLIISSGGNSGSQAATLVIRALALKEVRLKDWWRVMWREILSGFSLGIILGAIGFLRITVWSAFSPVYGEHWLLLAVTVAVSLIGIVLWGTLVGSMLPFLLRRLGFDPATSSAPFVATLVDVTGLVIYFGVAALILSGTLL